MVKNNKNKSASDRKMRKIAKDIMSRDTETKYHQTDNTGNSFPVDVAGVVFQVCSVPDGTLDIERIGGIIRAHRLEVKLHIEHEDVLKKPVTCRMIIFRNNCQGNQNDNQSFVIEGGQVPTEALYNWNNRKILQIVHDKTWVLDPNNGPTNISYTANVFKTAIMKFDGPGGNSNGMGRYQILFMTDAPTVTDSPAFGFASRLYFKDA